MPVNRDDVKKTLENNKRFLEYTENKNDPNMAVMILKPGSKAKKPPKIMNHDLVTKIVDGVVAGKTMVSTSEKSIITTDTYGLAGSLCYVLNKMFEQGTINGDKVFVIALSDIPSTLTTYSYTIGTSNISWTEYSIFIFAVYSAVPFPGYL